MSNRLVAVVSCATLLTVLSGTVLNADVSTLGESFHASLLRVQWLVTAFLLAMTATIPVSAWASERYGARQVWLGACGGFGLASLLCAAAGSIVELICFRVLQGVAAGLILPVGQTIVVRETEARKLGAALTLVAMVNTMGPALGPALGGLAIGAGGWRWLFVATALPSAGLVVAGRRVIPSIEVQADVRLDFVGLAQVVPGIAALIGGLAAVASAGAVDLGSGLLLAIGLLLVAAFFRHAWGRADALFALDLLRGRQFRAGAVINVAFGALMFGFLFLMPLFLELVGGASPARAGVLMLPQGLGSLLTLAVIGRIADHRSLRPLIIGGVLVISASTAYFALVPFGPTWTMEVVLLTRGLGLSCVFVPALTLTYVEVSPTGAASASALLNLALRFGSSAGTALTAAVLQQRLGNFARGIETGSLGTGSPPAEVVTAFSVAFGLVVIFSLSALRPALMLADRRRRAAR